MIRNYKINKSPSISGLYTFRTNNVEKKVWEYLRRFQNINYVETLLISEIPPISQNFTLIHRKAEDISSAIIQAEEYFETAKLLSMRTRPLILYYGMVSLAKCLIMLGDNSYTLEANQINRRHGSHGLTTSVDNRMPRTQAARNSDSLVDEFVRVNNGREPGVFSLLHSCYADQMIANNTIFTIKELLSLFGEDWRKYYDYFHEAPRVWKIGGASINGTAGLTNSHIMAWEDYFSILNRQNQNETYEQVRARCFPRLTADYIFNQSNNNNCWTSSECLSIDSHIVVSESLSREHFALIDIANSHLNDIDMYFLLMYTLSSLARYNQNKWSKLISRTSNDEMFLIEGFVGVCQVKFPLLLLRELEGKDYQLLGEVSTWG